MEDQLRKPNPLIQEKHSLEPDMLFGWRPKQLQKKGPIPIFYLSSLPTRKHKEYVREIYNGPRPVDSFQLHKAFQFTSKYNFNFSDPMISAWNYLSKKNLQKYPEKRRFEGMSRNAPENALHFDSNFESGNLDKVVMIDENRYDLYLRTDTNSKTKQLWYYFSISNVTHSRVVEFNIVNLQEKAQIYEIGFRPVMFSVYNNKLNSSIGWEKIFGNVRYTRSKINQMFSTPPAKPFYQLTFELDLTVHDKVFVAPSKPYTCTDLCRFLDTISSPIFKLTTPCETLGGIPIPMITITDPNVPKSSKKYVVITGRIHPVDNYSSVIIEGIIEYLLRDEPTSRAARSTLIFKIFPMCDPDGVVAGNTKNSLAGRDLNYCFYDPDEKIFPLPYYLNSLVKKHSRNLLVFFNVESNYKKKGSFMFGPYYPIHERMYYMSRVIPKLFSDRTCMFRYFSCQFLPEPNTNNAPHKTFDKMFSVLGYSFQTSVYGYIDENRETVEYTESDLRQLGEHLVSSAHGYDLILKENQEREKQRAMERFMKQKSFSRSKSISDSGFSNIVEIIKKKEETLQVDSDIEKWTDEEDEIDEHPMIEIVCALNEFNHLLQENRFSHNQINKARNQMNQQRSMSLAQSSKIKIVKKDYLSLKKPNEYGRTMPEGYKMNVSVYGNHTILKQPMLPKLKPRLKKRLTSFSHFKVNSNPDSLHESVNFTKYVPHNYFPKPRHAHKSQLYYSKDHQLLSYYPA